MPNENELETNKAQLEEARLTTSLAFIEIMKAFFQLFKNKVLSWFSKVEQKETLQEGVVSLEVEGEKFNYSILPNKTGGTDYKPNLQDIPDNKKAAALDAMCLSALRAALLVSPNADMRVVEGEGAEDLKAALARARAIIAKEKQSITPPVMAAAALTPTASTTPTASAPPLASPVSAVSDETRLQQLDKEINDRLAQNPDREALPKKLLEDRNEVLDRVMRARDPGPESDELLLEKLDKEINDKLAQNPDRAALPEKLLKDRDEVMSRVMRARDPGREYMSSDTPLDPQPTAPIFSTPQPEPISMMVPPPPFYTDYTPPPSFPPPAYTPQAPQLQPAPAMAPEPPPPTKLVCIDFDETVTDKHVHNYLSRQKGTPSPIHEDGAVIIKNGVISDPNNPNRNFGLSPANEARYLQDCQEISASVPLKEKEQMRDTIRTTLQNGGKVAITSYNKYPHAIPATLASVGLTPEEISQVTIVAGFPKDGPQTPNGKQEHMEVAAQVVSQESGVVIQKSDTMLIDDSSKNVAASETQGYAPGVVVKAGVPTNFSLVTDFTARPVPKPEPSGSAPTPQELTNKLEANPAPSVDVTQYGPPPPKSFTPARENYQESQPPLVPKPAQEPELKPEEAAPQAPVPHMKNR